MANYLNAASLRRYIFIIICPILLCACQSASVTWSSDPPGAYASGYYKSGTYYRQALPMKIVYSPSELPRGFPASCGVVKSPTITWPDGTVRDRENIRVCYVENNYTFTKPESTRTNYSAPEVKKPAITEKQERPQSAPLKSVPDTSPKDSQKKCLRLGLTPGSDDFNLCIKSK